MMKYIFVTNLVWEITVNTNHYKLGQTLANLTGTNPMVAFFLGRREYLFMVYLACFCLASCYWTGEDKNLVSSAMYWWPHSPSQKEKKKRGRSLAMCVWTIVSLGLGLTSTFGSLSYNQSQPKTHGMVRSACFLAAAISFSAQHMWLAFATTISLLCCTHPNASPDTTQETSFSKHARTRGHSK